MKTKINIVLIDNDPVSVYLFQRALGSIDASKYALFKFTSGREALKHFLNSGRNDERYVILMDVHMGFMSGWDFLDLVRRMYPDNARIIIISSTHDREIIEKVTRYEQVVSYFEKPLSSETLSEIGKLLGQMVSTPI